MSAETLCAKCGLPHVHPWHDAMISQRAHFAEPHAFEPASVSGAPTREIGVQMANVLRDCGVAVPPSDSGPDDSPNSLGADLAAIRERGGVRLNDPRAETPPAPTRCGFCGATRHTLEQCEMSGAVSYRIEKRSETLALLLEGANLANAELRAEVSSLRDSLAGVGRDSLPLHVRNRVVRDLRQSSDAEAERFKPGRMHHNGPRRIDLVLDVQYAKLLLAHLDHPATPPEPPAVPQPATPHPSETAK